MLDWTLVSRYSVREFGPANVLEHGRERVACGEA